MSVEFIRQDEAAEAIKKADNLATNQLVNMAMVQALLFTPKETQEWPVANFDMKFFVEVMLNLFKEQNHNNLRKILAGKDLRWWDDDDFK